MTACLGCGQETRNPKFCSRSCAARSNNRTAPKRKLINQCASCSAPIRSQAKYCKGCWVNLNERDWSLVTLGDLKGEGNAVRGGNYPMIRQLSRKWYKSAGRPMCCHECGYDLHVDICHIRDLKDYPQTALVTEVNDQTNLVALCKNHHWEFDHGHLVLRGAGGTRTHIFSSD